jgi:hypothetical protein
MRRHLNELLLALVLVLVGAAGAPARVAAQEQPALSIDVSAGYEGTYRIGEWFPVSIDVSNNGPDASGVLEWNFPGQDDEQVFRQQIDLPRGSRKRITLSVYAERNPRNGQVRFLSGQTVLATQDVKLTAVDDTVFLIGVVSGDPALLNSLDTLQFDGFSDASVQHIDAAELPDHVAPLRSLNALFLQDVDSAALSSAQRDAIALWVSLGGQLVVGGGVGGHTTAAGLADLLPAQVSDAVAPGDLAPLADLVGAAEPLRAPDTPLSQVQPRPNAEQAPPGAGLLYRWRYGAGVASFSTFNLASLRGWTGEPALWGAMLAYQEPPAAGADSRLGGVDLLDRRVLQLRPLSLPPANTLLIFLLGYILIIGPLNYLVLRRLRRLEWAWLTIPLIVLLFACGLYLVGSVLRGGQTQFYQAAVVQGAERQGRANATAFVGLFSPRRATYTVGFPPDTLVSGSTSRAGLPDRVDAVLVDATGARSADVLADVGSVNTFVAHAMIDLPVAVESSVISDTNGLRAQVRNTGSTVLDDALIVYGESFAPLGSVAPGASGRVESGDFKPNFPRALGLSSSGVFDRQEMLEVLFDRDNVGLRAPALSIGTQLDEQGVYLLAWSVKPVVATSIDGQPASQNGVTLYVIRLATG